MSKKLLLLLSIIVGCNYLSYAADLEIVPVGRAKASSYQGSAPIEKSYDGDPNTIYHSNWTNTAPDYLPITLDYYFYNLPDLDYLIYHPRTSGVNGNFKEFELWASTAENPDYHKIGDYDFKGSSTLSQVDFVNRLKEVKGIRFVVKSGVGSGQGFASCGEMEFFGIVKKVEEVEGIEENIKVTVSRGGTSSNSSGGLIEKSFDGDMSTIYHSNWTNTAPDYFPITLNYYFDTTPNLDYLVYYPRTSGSNGHFKEFELWVSTTQNPTYVKYGNYDFKGSASPSRIDFKNGLKGVKGIRFVVTSGAGDGQGFASCAEMEFYQFNPNKFDYSLLFTDTSCSELKAGITEVDINKIENTFFKKLALSILKGTYNKEFRIQSYKPYQRPEIMTKYNKNAHYYSLRDNPTGISVKTGQDLVVCVGETNGQPLSLFIQDLEKGFTGAGYPLSIGTNKIKVPNNGLVYIMYHTDRAVEKPIKINIATGDVNGYFDSQKHTSADWTRLLKGSVDKHFDVVGKYAHLTFPTQKFIDNTPDGKALIDLYDEIVWMEQDFMGLVKYDRMFNNRMYFAIAYTNTYMFSTNYYTGYSVGTINGLTNPDKLRKDPWGVAHEVGHSNQTFPGLRWHGMAEVTNNIYSMYVQSSLGNPTRLQTEKLTGYTNRYEKGFNTTIAANAPHNMLGGDVFCKLIPFWQLKLYFHDVKGNKEYYKDLFQYLRTHEDVTSPGLNQLNFARIVCDQGKEDLTEFFEAWGFFTPIDVLMDDYGKKQFRVTQQQIDSVKAEIASRNYPKATLNLKYLYDDIVPAYKGNLPISFGIVNIVDNQITITNAKNIVAYEVYDADILIHVYTTNNFSLGDGDLTKVQAYAISASGERTLVYPNVISSIRDKDEIVQDNVNARVSVVDRYIIVDQELSYEVYSITGLKLNPKQRFAPGIYIVKIGDEGIKVMVR